MPVGATDEKCVLLVGLLGIVGSMQELMTLADMNPEAASNLVRRAHTLRDGGPTDIAKGLTLGLLFLNSSLRTRTSMVAAMAYLGGQSVVLSQSDGMWKLASDDQPMTGDEAEHIEEAAGVLGRLCDVLGVRAFASGDSWLEDRKDTVIRTFLKCSRAPFINLESGMYHPCQALADWLTLNDHEVAANDEFVLSWAYHPKALQQAVPNSALTMAAARGMKVTLLRPDGYQLDEGVMDKARSFASQTGGSIRESDDPSVLKNARVVYAKSWGSLKHYGNAKAEQALRKQYKNWCVGNDTLKVGSESKLMHCLPVRRDVVVTTELLKSKHSLILDQAENRKWAQVAVLDAMVRSIL